jgi:biofilm PGA synthesis protein PgaA
MEQMEEIIRWQERLERLEVDIPVWTLGQFADAYLYLQQPEAALELYEEVLGQEWDPQGSTRLAIYDTLIELGRYKEADEELAGVDRDTPVQVVNRGILRDNWIKEDVAMKHAWSLMYQDRLKEAQAYLEELLSVAPLNTHTRTALAHTYLWRGWPRRALEEFRISGNLDEEEVSNRIGECYALNENDRGEEARTKAQELLKEFPANKHVQRLNRYFEVQDMRTLTVDGAYSTEDPGAEGVYWSVRVDQPIKPWRSMFAEYVWRRSEESDASDLRRRWRTGFDWRLNRDWWSTVGFSIDENGANAGHFETLTFTPDDRWLFSASYDSYAIDVPLRAAVTGVEAQETSFLARYRASEDFTAETSALWRDYTDGNQQYVYGLRLDKGLTTSAYWKTRLMFDGFWEFNSENDRDYFSPESLYGFYLVPMVEHTWFRRYERALVDRFFAGVGDQWQKGYSGDTVWYVRYELDYRLSDVFSILAGTTYAQKYYDGDDTKVWTPYLTMKVRF